MNFNLKPSNNTAITEIQNAVWTEWWKKYRRYSNANSDKEYHITDELWKQAIREADDLYQRFPCEFTSNLLSAYIDELQARDLGSYPDKYSGAHQALTEKKHDLQEHLEEKEGFV
ncbi:MAG: hypothetical protein ACTTHL_00945 [Oribacterium sp.]